VRRGGLPDDRGRLAGGADRDAAGEGLLRLRRRAARLVFLPARDAGGLPIGALDDGQRKLAHELIAAGTSLPGYAKVVSVMAMEHVLRALTPATADPFDPERIGIGEDPVIVAGDRLLIAEAQLGRCRTADRRT
jgi:hypothetical protein